MKTKCLDEKTIKNTCHETNQMKTRITVIDD